MIINKQRTLVAKMYRNHGSSTRSRTRQPPERIGGGQARRKVVRAGRRERSEGINNRHRRGYSPMVRTSVDEFSGVSFQICYPLLFYCSFSVSSPSSPRWRTLPHRHQPPPSSHQPRWRTHTTVYSQLSIGETTSYI
jgi:hypothetical protein